MAWTIGIGLLFGQSDVQAVGSVSATITIAQRSLSVSPSKLTFSCKKGGPTPAFPNDECTSNVVTIVNGDLPARVLVEGRAVLVDPTFKQWRLCGDPGQACTGKGGKPGLNEYSMRVQPASTERRQHSISTTQIALFPRCDIAFGLGSCAASPRQTQREVVVLIGPSESTLPAINFAPKVSWSAATP